MSINNIWYVKTFSLIYKQFNIKINVIFSLILSTNNHNFRYSSCKILIIQFDLKYLFETKMIFYTMSDVNFM